MLDFLIQAGSKVQVLTWGDSNYTSLEDKEIVEITRVIREIPIY